MAPIAKDLGATLIYAQDDGKRPYVYMWLRTREQKEKSAHQADFQGTGSKEHVTVHDARAREKQATLRDNGFELIESETTLSTEDFYNCPDKIATTYYQEMERDVKRATGASHILTFHHQVRNARIAKQTDGKRAQDLNQPVQLPVHGIHTDSHPLTAEKNFKFETSMPHHKQYQKGRFMFLNVWRNIADRPVERDNLAVLDCQSLTKPDDFLVSDLFSDSHTGHQYMLNCRNKDRHRWYYYPEMRRDELLMFVQYDSDLDRTGRSCFHTAFKADGEEATDETGEPRQSIEARMLLFFPDHEPNTCPEPLPEVDEEEGVDLAAAEASVEKMLEAIETMYKWPAANFEWLRRQLLKTPQDIPGIAHAFAGDALNVFDLRDAGPAQKRKAAELLLAKDLKVRLESRLEATLLMKKMSGEDGPLLPAWAPPLAAGAALGVLCVSLLNRFRG